jgi:hypothetical protein
MKKTRLRKKNKSYTIMTKKESSKLKCGDIVLIYEIGTSWVVTLAEVIETNIKLITHDGDYIKYVALNGKWEGQEAFIRVNNIIKKVNKHYPEYCI